MDEEIARLAEEYMADPTQYIESRNIEYPESEAEEHSVIDRDTHTTVTFSALLDANDNPVIYINNINGDARISAEDLEAFKEQNVELYAMFASRAVDGVPVIYSNEQNEDVTFPSIQR